MLRARRARWYGEIAKFYYPLRYPLPMLHPKRGEWGSVTLCGAKDALDCHPKWVSSRCRTSRPCYHTLSLLQECFWWPGMAKQMRQVIKACKCCLQYEGGTPKAPLCPIVATAPLDLLHVDFTSIETTLELNQLPRVTNVLVFKDHFTKHVLAYVTPDQTAKTITKFLYGGYISIFGAPARLLSDRGTSFTSSIIEELCKILGVQWLQTMPTTPRLTGW